MVYLRNIKRTDTTLSADYDPENSGKLGHLVISRETGELLEYTLSEEDPAQWYWSYISHAACGLRELINKEELPETRLIMWY